VGPDRGERARVLEVAAEARVAERVHLLDYVERSDLLALYRGAEALVFPSRYEGFGLPLLEAMACGTPVVAAATTAIPEVAGDAAVLVPAGDPEALADGVERALADADRLVAAGLAHAAQHTWAVTARRTAAVYAEVLAR
jgi:glycosyltransferase involved in cell wall biosynthesis